MRRKTFDTVEAKGDETGQFTALASVFGNVDLVGDRMVKGAFRSTLKRWRDSGDPIPVILSHNHDDPFAMVGEADPRGVYESDEGLVVQGQLDLADNPMAKQVHKLMKNRLLKGWSFGYTIPDGGAARTADGVTEVKEVDLIEVGPTLKGANPLARLEAVKALPEAELDLEPEIIVGGERFSLKEARDALGLEVPDAAEAALLLKWDGSAGRYTDAEYVSATILDKAVCDDALRGGPAKIRYSLPIANPGQSATDNPDRGGVIAAAGRLGQTAACSAAKTAAAKRLIRAYGKFPDLTVPDSVRSLAGMASAEVSGNGVTSASSMTITSTTGVEASQEPPKAAQGAETDPEGVKRAIREAIGEAVAEAVAREFDKRKVEDPREAADGGKSGQDPLRKRADDLEAELLGSGAAPREKNEEKADEPEPEAGKIPDLQRRAHDLILRTLTE